MVIACGPPSPSPWCRTGRDGELAGGGVVRHRLLHVDEGDGQGGQPDVAIAAGGRRGREHGDVEAGDVLAREVAARLGVDPGDVGLAVAILENVRMSLSATLVRFAEEKRTLIWAVEPVANRHVATRSRMRDLIVGCPFDEEGRRRAGTSPTGRTPPWYALGEPPTIVPPDAPPMDYAVLEFGHAMPRLSFASPLEHPRRERRPADERWRDSGSSEVLGGARVTPAIANSNTSVDAVLYERGLRVAR